MHGAPALAADGAGATPHLALDVFEGPLGLLLTLIEHRKLAITEVSLAQVASQYLEQLGQLPAGNADLLAEFVAIGGKLILIKSRTLLLSNDPEPPVDEDETAAELEQRLVAYRCFRLAADLLREREEQGLRSFVSLREPALAVSPAPLAPITAAELARSWARFQNPSPKQARAVAQPAELRASVDQARAIVLERLGASETLSFRALCQGTPDAVIALFLAVLELMRHGSVVAHQTDSFTDIAISHVQP